MKIEQKDKFTIDIPVAYFMPADFKSKSTFYKHIDQKYDVRKRFKELYRYYSDVYAFNKREGDCLKMNVRSLKSYGLVVCPSINDFVTKISVINSLLRMKNYILKEIYLSDKYYSIQICMDGLAPYISEDELKEVIEDVFKGVPMTVYLFRGSGLA